MTLIEVNNKDVESNYKLLEQTEEWAKNWLVETDYVIVLNPNLKIPIKITEIKNP